MVGASSFNALRPSGNLRLARLNTPTPSSARTKQITTPPRFITRICVGQGFHPGKFQFAGSVICNFSFPLSRKKL